MTLMSFGIIGINHNMFRDIYFMCAQGGISMMTWGAKYFYGTVSLAWIETKTYSQYSSTALQNFLIRSCEHLVLEGWMLQEDNAAAHKSNL